MAQSVVYEAEPDPLPEPEVVQIEVKIDWTKERIIQEINDTFPDAPIMVAVAKCESGLVPTAKNPTSSASGIFQILMSLHGPSLGDLDVWNPADNIKFARILYDNGGLAHWSESARCWSG
jgi:hypothetical protein